MIDAAHELFACLVTLSNHYLPPPLSLSPSLPRTLPAWYMLMLPPPESKSAVCPRAFRAFLTNSIFSSLESSSQSTRNLMHSTTLSSYCSTRCLVPLKARLCKACRSGVGGWGED